MNRIVIWQQMIELSSETIVRIRRTLPESVWHSVEELLLNECGDNLPLVDASYIDRAERIRFAVLKCSGGDLSALKRLLENAKQDWRTTLMVAGFGDGVTNHLRW